MSASAIRLAKYKAHAVSLPGPVVTRLSRFDAQSWSKKQVHHGNGFQHGNVGFGGPFQTQASSMAASGTSVSMRQMAALHLTRTSKLGSITHEQRLRFGSPGAAVDKPPLGVMKLQDLLGTEYVGQLAVGTRSGSPQANLRVIYDTGSTDLWVLSDLCKKYPCTAKGHNVYNHSDSESFYSPRDTPLSTGYGSGELHGRVGFDNVHVGPLVAKGQIFGLISEEIGETFAMSFDGLVGLGFPSLVSTTGVDTPNALPLIDNLMQQGQLQTPMFAFYLHSDPAYGGAVLWGGIDERLYKGTLMWFPVVEEAYWSLDLISFRIGNRIFDFEHKIKTHTTRSGSVVETKPRLVVDSGTTFFTAPSYIYHAIDVASGRLKCGDLLGSSMVFTVRDESGKPQEITVPPMEYMVHNSHFCYPGVMAMDMPVDEQPIMIIGEVFMRHFFTVFHRGKAGESSRVGLARSREDSEAAAFFEGLPA